MITGIEGNSFSGKSSLACKLELEYGFQIVNEPSYYVASFPHQPKDIDDAKKNLNFFTEVEQRRSADANALLIKNGGDVVMDRTIWTYIHYEYTLLKKHPEIPNAYYYALDALQKLAIKGDIIIPPVLIALTPGTKQTFENRIAQRRPAGIAFLNEWETTTIVDSLLIKLIGVYGARNGVMIINDKTIDILALQAKEFIDNSPNDAIFNLNLAFDTLRTLE
ncbi:hypothetical protein M0R04_03720 [Candidatus Dojkabacteria bacterium]|jgi:deoxyadenosine/deoxycytidine kinase|nr:hypothetical protein [Candidatus Dojkabacteria bacterium]